MVGDCLLPKIDLREDLCSLSGAMAAGAGNSYGVCVRICGWHDNRPPGGVLHELAVDLAAFILAYVIAWSILPNGRKIGLEMFIYWQAFGDPHRNRQWRYPIQIMQTLLIRGAATRLSRKDLPTPS